MASENEGCIRSSFVCLHFFILSLIIYFSYSILLSSPFQESANDIDVEMEEKRILLSYPSEAAPTAPPPPSGTKAPVLIYYADVALSYPVLVDECEATFDKSTRKLILLFPVNRAEAEKRNREIWAQQRAEEEAAVKATEEEERKERAEEEEKRKKEEEEARKRRMEAEEAEKERLRILAAEEEKKKKLIEEARTKAEKEAKEEEAKKRIEASNSKQEEEKEAVDVDEDEELKASTKRKQVTSRKKEPLFYMSLDDL